MRPQASLLVPLGTDMQAVRTGSGVPGSSPSHRHQPCLKLLWCASSSARAAFHPKQHRLP